MGLREALNQNKAASLGAVVALLLVALVVLALTLSGGDAAPSAEDVVPATVWFYDVGDGTLFTEPGEEAGPVEPPSDATLSSGEPGGVKANVFACNDCSDPDDRYVGYVEIVPPEHRETPAHLRTDMHNSVAEAPEGGGTLEWFPQSSPQGQQIMQAARQRCEGGEPERCLPPTE